MVLIPLSFLNEGTHCLEFKSIGWYGGICEIYDFSLVSGHRQSITSGFQAKQQVFQTLVNSWRMGGVEKPFFQTIENTNMPNWGVNRFILIYFPVLLCARIAKIYVWQRLIYRCSENILTVAKGLRRADTKKIIRRSSDRQAVSVRPLFYESVLTKAIRNLCKETTIKALDNYGWRLCYQAFVVNAVYSFDVSVVDINTIMPKPLENEEMPGRLLCQKN